MKKIIFPIIALMSCGQLNSSQAQQIKDNKKDSLYNYHENMSKARYKEMQKKLDEYVANGDTNGLRLLSAQLDAQLKVEDFLIRFREVDSIKFTLLGTGFLTVLSSIITTLLTLFIKQRYSPKPSPDVAKKIE